MAHHLLEDKILDAQIRRNGHRRFLHELRGGDATDAFLNRLLLTGRLGRAVQEPADKPEA
jgi:hypothetical protein